LDSIALAIDIFSVGVLGLAFFIGFRSVRAFRQSKQAVVESASVLSVIVSSLTSRIEASELLVADVRNDLRTVERQNGHLEAQQSDIHANYLRVLRYLQEILSTDNKLITELDQLKTRVSTVPEKRIPPRALTSLAANPMPILGENAVAALTQTESQVLEILRREGPKAAPELGHRMRKSREHMARLMKKLYLDGYVDRESNRAPFRYKLNEKVGSMLEHGETSVTAAASEKA
jgi:hypothetical protein